MPSPHPLSTIATCLFRTATGQWAYPPAAAAYAPAPGYVPAPGVPLRAPLGPPMMHGPYHPHQGPPPLPHGPAPGTIIYVPVVPVATYPAPTNTKENTQKKAPIWRTVYWEKGVDPSSGEVCWTHPETKERRYRDPYY